MSESIEIEPVHGPIVARIRPPGSKSITNRALVCAALARGASTLVDPLHSDDTRVMIDALRQLGVQIETPAGSHRWTVTGCGGEIGVCGDDLYVGNSGTTIRFLTPLVALGSGGRYRLTGDRRMHERPIQDLVDALELWGAEVECEKGNGCPPVIVQAGGLRGGTAAVRGDISSQFLSGLLMAAPYTQQPAELVVDGQLVSEPYARMTVRVMSSFGVAVTSEDGNRFSVPSGQAYRAAEYAIEPDASAASYFWAAAAITGGRVTVEGLSLESAQGDVAFCNRLEQMGCQVEYGSDQITVTGGTLTGIDTDMGPISDTVQSLAAVALFADGPTTVRGVGHIRHKETNRISDLATELRKLGAAVSERDDGLTITPSALTGAALTGASIDTYNDHRMAMSLALVGLKVPGVVIRDPSCTEKTFPGFFEVLGRVSGTR